MTAKGSKKPATKSARSSSSKTKTKPAAKAEVVERPTPDMIGRVMETGREMQDWDPEKIYEIIEQHPILSKNMDFFRSLSQDELKAIIGDATGLVLRTMGEMR